MMQGWQCGHALFLAQCDGYDATSCAAYHCTAPWCNIVIDDSAKTRPEGPNLTVTPALRLAKRATSNSYWKLTLTKQGLVLEATSGKYEGWFWDFGGGDPSHEESGRQVAVNVLLAEKVVAGSYFAVKAAE